MKKVAIYCRVSSEDQKERDTIQNQVEILNTYIEFKDDLQKHDEFLDDAVSGTVPFQERPAAKRLIEDAKKGLFDTVLVWKVDRFGRDTLSGLQAIELLEQLKIEVISSTEPFDLNTATGRFQFIMYLNMAELERNNILDRMFLGATRAAKKGQWLGGIVPYGYIVNKDKYLEVEESEASVIRMIYHLYTVEKMSSINIAIYLNDRGVVTSCSEGKGKRTKNITKLWRSSSIQRILTSTTYIGIHEYGKRSSKRKETISREVPSIIPIEVFNQAAKQRDENQIKSIRACKNRNFILRQKISCGVCGKTFYGITYKNRNDVYSCSGKKTENKKILGIKCTNVNLICEDIENEVISSIIYYIKNYENFVSEAKENDKTKELNEEIEIVHKKIESTNIEKKNILSLFRKGIIDESDLEEQLEDIKTEEKKYKSHLESLREKVSMLENHNELKSESEKIIEYYKAKIDNLSDDDKSNLISIFINKIIVNPEIVDGEKSAKLDIYYNLFFNSDVKLGICTDKYAHSKFDITKKKLINESLPIYIGCELNRNIGIKLKTLRLENNMMLKTLSKLTNISDTTIRSIEKGTIKYPFNYWHSICTIFNVDANNFLQLYTLSENNTKEKLLKLRALVGSSNWKDVSDLLGIEKTIISDLYNNNDNRKDYIIDKFLSKIKGKQ